MTEEWLIDGCNLQHSHPSKNWYERMASFASSRNCRVLYVLDGKGNESQFDKYRTALFQIVFAQGTSADCAIERYLYENKGKFRFTVVTNDRTITNMAKGMGSMTLRNDVFMDFLKESEQNTKDIVWDQKVKSHGFHRPFDQKLKDKGIE